MTALKYTRINDVHGTFHDALTNDPIANVQKINKKTFVATWHPAFKQMYPEVTEHLSLAQPATRDTLDGTKYAISNSYEDVQEGITKDPLKARYIGEIEKDISANGFTQKRKFKHYSLHDEDGNHLASLNIASAHSHDTQAFEASNRFNAYSPDERKLHAHIDWVGDKPTAEQHKMLITKYPDNHPKSLMDRVKYYQTIKHKEPSFVGISKSDNLHMYKTKLSPEDAAKKYLDHIKSRKDFAGYNIQQLSPHHIIAGKPYESVGDGESFTHHTIDTSTPGIVRHFRYAYKGPGHYGVSPLPNIIE